jgi:arsenate reductase
MKRRILFLCTGNSCRSQMAEAIVNARYPEWLAFSAGTHPNGFVHPMAIQVLQEIGIVHKGVSKNVEQFRDDEFDLVVTVCDDANEECPVWLGQGKRRHESFRDPAKVQGTEEERLAVFREVRDELVEKIPGLLK